MLYQHLESIPWQAFFLFLVISAPLDARRNAIVADCSFTNSVNVDPEVSRGCAGIALGKRTSRSDRSRPTAATPSRHSASTPRMRASLVWFGWHPALQHLRVNVIHESFLTVQLEDSRRERSALRYPRHRFRATTIRIRVPRSPVRYFPQNAENLRWLDRDLETGKRGAIARGSRVGERPA